MLKKLEELRRGNVVDRESLAGYVHRSQKHRENYLGLGKNLILVEDKARRGKKLWCDVSKDGISGV